MRTVTRQYFCVTCEAMARPIVVRTKSDVAGLVALLVIPADCIKPRLRCLSIEPDARKQASCSLNALHRSALALVVYCFSLEASLADMICEAHSSNVAMLGTVMGEYT